jgi:transcriptional regulator with XRE-family HTH domain
MSDYWLVLIRRMAENGAARSIREAAGLSLAEMGAAANVDKSTIWRWETRRRRPRGESARRWLNALEDLSR